MMRMNTTSLISPQALKLYLMLFLLLVEEPKAEEDTDEADNEDEPHLLTPVHQVCLHQHSRSVLDLVLLPVEEAEAEEDTDESDDDDEPPLVEPPLHSLTCTQNPLGRPICPI